MSAISDRRVRQDRRNFDVGPPVGWRDRRRCAERRQIEVAETSFREWAVYKAKWLMNKKMAETAPRCPGSTRAASTIPSGEQRHEADRRKEDIGPPLNFRERRHRPERRTPEVREVSMDDWLSSIDLR
jgi:hypothetical protein